EREELGTPIGRRRDRDHRQLALDRLSGLELADAKHVHELVHLLLDLIERVLRAVDAESDPRDVVALGRADGEALDVVAPPREHLRDPDEGARLVLDEDGERVNHDGTRSRSPYSIRSSAAAPAGIIGKHSSSGSTRTSTTAGRRAPPRAPPRGRPRSRRSARVRRTPRRASRRPAPDASGGRATAALRR